MLIKNMEYLSQRLCCTDGEKSGAGPLFPRVPDGRHRVDRLRG